MSTKKIVPNHFCMHGIRFVVLHKTSRELILLTILSVVLKVSQAYLFERCWNRIFREVYLLSIIRM